MGSWPLNPLLWSNGCYSTRVLQYLVSGLAYDSQECVDGSLRRRALTVAALGPGMIAFQRVRLRMVSE
jgi:hypothetical protein